MVWKPQTSFKYGEITPRLDGFSNPEIYDASCRKVEGAIVSSNGTIEKRKGTSYRGDTAFSTATYPTENFTNTAVKLIPFKSGPDTYALVFEVLQQQNAPAGPTTTWGSIRAVKDDVFYTATGSNTYTGTQIWKERTYANLPFKAPGTLPSPADVAYLPPGGDATFTKLFGWHHFTAAQLPDVTYFQHEDSLIVCHSETPPMEVFKDDDGYLDTRLYPVVGRSPMVENHGESFTMIPTTTDAGLNYTVATTRDWFDESDLGAIYRLGWCKATEAVSNAGADFEPVDIGEESDDRGGFFAVVTIVNSPTSASMRSITDLNVGTRTYTADTSDPHDWDGPWVREATSSCNFGHTRPGRRVTHIDYDTTTNLTTYENAPYSEISIPWNLTLQEGAGTPLFVGDIIANRQNVSSGTGNNTSNECYALITGAYDTTFNPANLPTSVHTAQIINGEFHPSSTQPGWGTSTSADDFRLSLARIGWPGGAVLPHDLSGQSLFTLRTKREEQLADPLIRKDGPITISRAVNANLTTRWYSRLKEGDTVNLTGGNITVAPSGHYLIQDPPHDTYQHGDLAAPAATAIPLGGTIHVNNGVFAAITDVSPNYSQTFIVISPPTSMSTTNKYSLGWSPTVGYPSCGTSHQGRVLFAGFESEKRTVIGSSQENAKDFSLGGTTSDGFHFLVNDLRGSRVRWLSSGKDLLIGTTTGEFSVGGSPLSALSIGVDRQSAYGSASIRPVIIGNHLFFVQKDRKTIRAMKYNFGNQRYQSANATQVHSQFFNDGTIQEMSVWEGEEDPVLLVRLSNGEVLSARINEIENFLGWTRMKLPLCSSLCPSRNPEAAVTGATAADSFYLALNDTGKYRLAQYDDTVYLDEAELPTITGTNWANYVATLSTTRLHGLDVSVLVDGVYRGEVTVTSNTVSLTGLISPLGGTPVVVVGKKIPMVFQPRVPEVGGSARGTTSSLGRLKNYSAVVVNLLSSKGVDVNGYPVDGLLFSTALTVSSHSEFTGWYNVPVTGLYGIQPLIEISSDRPYPVEVSGITINLSVEG
jgi:hypothetical protein